MLSVALFYLLAVICSATRTHALPLYPNASLEPQSDFIQKLVSEVGGGLSPAEGEPREVNSLYPVLVQHNGGRDSWNKGDKDSAQQDKFSNMVEDLKEAVLKLAAADKLRSQGFLRSEQNLPKTNKRGTSLHLSVPGGFITDQCDSFLCCRYLLNFINTTAQVKYATYSYKVCSLQLKHNCRESACFWKYCVTN